MLASFTSYFHNYLMKINIEKDKFCEGYYQLITGNYQMLKLLVGQWAKSQHYLLRSSFLYTISSFFATFVYHDDQLSLSDRITSISNTFPNEWILCKAIWFHVAGKRGSAIKSIETGIRNQ